MDRVIDTRVDKMFVHFTCIAEDYAKSSEEMAKMWMDFKEKQEYREETGKVQDKIKHLDIYLNVHSGEEAEKIVDALKGVPQFDTKVLHPAAGDEIEKQIDRGVNV